MIEVVLLVLFFVILGIVTRAKRPATENIAVVQERRRKGGRTKKLIGIVLLCLSVVIWAVVLLTPPKQPALPDYEVEILHELFAQGAILETSRPEEEYDTVQSRLFYTGATGDEYAEYWDAVDKARSMREAEFWNGMTLMIEGADGYMQNALMRAQ